MGKLLKKSVAIALVLTMVLSSGAFAFAADADEEVKTISAPVEKKLLLSLEELQAMEGLPTAPAQKPAVMLNGGYVAFTDAAPQNVNGRIMVPFRAILEALGATVNYDTKTKEISAVLDDKAISFYAGKADINVVDNGEKSVVKMDVVPFIDPASNRTYVPTRFMAEAFGLTVGWDSPEKTVIIIDMETMSQEIAEKFTVLGMIFDTTDFDWSKNYKTTGDVNLGMTLGADVMKEMTGVATATKADLSFDMDVNGIQKGLNADLDIAVEADIKDLYGALGIEGTPNEAYIDSIIEGLDMQIKMDDDNIYLHMPALAYLMSGADVTADVANNTWYKIPLSFVYDVYEESGMDFENIINKLNKPAGIAEYVQILADSMADSMDINTYYTVCTLVAGLEACIGDDEFKKSGNTYSISFDESWFSSKMKEFGVPDAVIGETMTELEQSGLDFDIDLSITATSAGKLSKYTLKGSLGLDDLGDGTSAKMAFEASGNNYDATVKFEFDIPDVMKLTMTTTEKLTTTSSAPDVKVPAGATIVDLSKAMAQ